MKSRLIFFVSTFLVFLITALRAQQSPIPYGAYSPGSPNSKKGGNVSVFNGNSTLATSYTATACGLNYVTANFNLNQRSFAGGIGTGAVQPAPFTVSGMPTCGKILRAFLYTGGEANSAPAITATILNPLGNTFNIPAVQIGVDAGKNWGYNNAYSFRADITAAITGNGTYFLSGIPATPGTADFNGATLFIIYTDETQNYTGSIVMADGLMSNTGPAGDPMAVTISGFNVCGNPILTNNFMIVDDLQRITNLDISFNSGASNYTEPPAAQLPWMLFSQPGAAATAGQNTASYGVYSGSDAFGVLLAGMYYRTGCMTCPMPMTVTASSSTCQPTGSATVSVVGAMPNATYSWLGTGQTASVATGLAAGIRSVTVSDPFNCKAPVTRTVNIIATMSLSATGSSCAPNNSATAVASGGLGGYTYTWTSTAQTTSLVTWMPTGTHTVTVSDAGACQTRTASVNVAASTSIATTNTVLCIGYSTTMTANAPVVSYSWSPAGNIQSPTNSPTVVANPNVTTIYTVTATNSIGCISSNTLQLFVVNTQTVPLINPTTCVNSTLQLVANTTYTGSTYQWLGPSGYSSAAQNPTRSPATLAMSGPYSITVISAPGCTSTAVANVTVYPIPTTPSITTNAPICSGFTLNLQGSGGTSYFWNGPNTFTSNLQNIAITNATNTLHSGVYTLTARFATGCSNTFTRNILVRALPVATLNSNSPVCLSKSLNLQGLGGVLYSWTGPNAFASALQNPTIAAVTVAAAGQYSLTVTDVFGCQGIGTHTVTVLNNPTVSATGTTVCYGYQAILTATGTGANVFTWYGPNNYSLAAQDATVNAVINPAVGVYTVILGSALNSCTATAMVPLANIPLPVMTTTGTSVCNGQPAVLLSAGAVSYSWTGPGGYSSTVQNTTISPATNTLIDTYTVIGTAANSCTAAATATLEARPNPTATAVGTTVCFGAPATLTASGGVNYSWTGPNSFTSTLQNATLAAVNNLTIDTYTVLVTAANSCTDVTTATLTTKPNPTITPTGTTVCLNLPAMLTASASTAGMTYTWSGPAGYSAAGATANIVSANSAAQQVYTVVGTAPNSCTHVVTANLNTFPLPTVTATGTLICLNEPFTLLGAGANTYTWTGPGIAGTATTASVFIPTVNAQSMGTYTLVATGANNCTNIAVASINTLALPSIVASGTTVCFGQPATLKANGGILNGYSWTGPGNYSANQANAFIASANNNSAGTYTVVGTAPNTCTNMATAVLNYYNLPVPTVTAPSRVCMLQSIYLYGGGASSYTWTGPYNFMTTASNYTLPVYNLLQEGTYTLSVLDNLGCFNFTTTTIKVDPVPDGVLVCDNANPCLPYCGVFSLRTSGDAPLVTGYSWEINNSAFYSTPSFSYCVTKATNTVVGSFTNALGCSSRISLGVGMQGYPVPHADFDFLPANPVESVDEVYFTNTSNGDKLNAWNWYFGSNKGYTSSTQHPSYVFENAGTYAVAMVVSNAYGCSDTVVKSVQVDPDYKLYVPNAFSPNGDGINDVFLPKGRGIDKYNLAIYDRWGSLVFQSNDFYKGWDGTEKGKPLSDDVYTWRINATDVNGKIKELLGHVTLLR